MCGIFAYVGTKTNAGDITLEGLKTLEYRGYDSWGVAVQDADGAVTMVKKTGKIGDAKLPAHVATRAFGHTRWATHGGVTDINAHPHQSASGAVVVVHNGIVENFEMLKKDLEHKNYSFVSQTDTEVLANLLEDLLSQKNDAQEAFIAMTAMIEGMNAVIAFFPKTHTFFVYKNGSPIVLGEGNGEWFIASDSAAILPHTRTLAHLEDGAMVRLDDTGFTPIGQNLERFPLDFHTMTYDPKLSELGSFPHFMLKEITEQEGVLRTIRQLPDAAIQRIADAIRESYGAYLVGCGTASYACLAGTYLFSKIAKRHINFSVSSEFAYLLDFIRKDSLIIALSQSGETIDTIAGVKHAQDLGARLISIVNVEGSTLYRMADDTLLLQAGPEKAVASTKAYTAKIALLYRIAHTIAGTAEVGFKHLDAAIREVKRLVDAQSSLKDLARVMGNREHIFVLGRGVSYAAALESALKIKEVSYIHAEGFAAGELKHGVIALIDPGTPVILFNPSDETYHDTLSAGYEVKARGAFVIGVSDTENPLYDVWINVKDCADATIIPNVVIAQLLGYFLALEKGYDPDKPRNLAKSVTVK